MSVPLQSKTERADNTTGQNKLADESRTKLTDTSVRASSVLGFVEQGGLRNMIDTSEFTNVDRMTLRPVYRASPTLFRSSSPISDSEKRNPLDHSMPPTLGPETHGHYAVRFKGNTWQHTFPRMADLPVQRQDVLTLERRLNELLDMCPQSTSAPEKAAYDQACIDLVYGEAAQMSAVICYELGGLFQKLRQKYAQVFVSLRSNHTDLSGQLQDAQKEISAAIQKTKLMHDEKITEIANLESQYRLMLHHAKSEFDKNYQEMKKSQEETMSLNRRLEERVSNLFIIFKYLKEDPVWDQVDKLKDSISKNTTYVRKLEYESSALRSKIQELQTSLADKTTMIDRMKEKSEKRVVVGHDQSNDEYLIFASEHQRTSDENSDGEESDIGYMERSQICPNCGVSINSHRQNSRSLSEMPLIGIKEEKKRAGPTLEELETQKRKQLDKIILEKLDNTMGTLQSVEIFDDNRNSKGASTAASSTDHEENQSQNLRTMIKAAVTDYRNISDEEAANVMLKSIEKFDSTVKTMSKKLSQAQYAVNENMHEVNKLKEIQLTLSRKMEERDKELDVLASKLFENQHRTFREIGVSTDEPKLKLGTGLAGSSTKPSKDDGKKKLKKDEDPQLDATPKHNRNAGDMMQWTLAHRKKIGEEIRKKSYIYRLIAKWNISVSAPPIPKIRHWTLNCIRCIYNDKELQDTMDDRIGKFRQAFPEFVYEWFGKKGGDRPTSDELLLQFLRMCKSLSKVLPEVSIFCKFVDELAFQEDHLSFFLQVRRALISMGCNLIGNELEVISTPLDTCIKVVDMILPDAPKAKKDTILKEVKGTAMFFDRTVDVAHFLEIILNMYDTERMAVIHNIERALEFLNTSLGARQVNFNDFHTLCKVLNYRGTRRQVLDMFRDLVVTKDGKLDLFSVMYICEKYSLFSSCSTHPDPIVSQWGKFARIENVHQSNYGSTLLYGMWMKVQVFLEEFTTLHLSPYPSMIAIITSLRDSIDNQISLTKDTLRIGGLIRHIMFQMYHYMVTIVGNEPYHIVQEELNLLLRLIDIRMLSMRPTKK